MSERGGNIRGVHNSGKSVIECDWWDFDVGISNIKSYGNICAKV